MLQQWQQAKQGVFSFAVPVASAIRLIESVSWWPLAYLFLEVPESPDQGPASPGVYASCLVYFGDIDRRIHTFLRGWIVLFGPPSRSRADAVGGRDRGSSNLGEGGSGG